MEHQHLITLLVGEVRDGLNDSQAALNFTTAVTLVTFYFT